MTHLLPNRILYLFIGILFTHLSVAQISGDTSVCAGETTLYSVPSVPGATYSWSVTNGSDLGASTDTAEILWPAENTGVIVVTTYHPDGTSSFLTLNVTIYPTPSPEIQFESYSTCPLPDSGQSTGEQDRFGCETVCPNTTISYFVDSTAGSTYNWLISGGSITSSSTNAAIDVVWDETATGEIIIVETNQWGCKDSSTLCIEKLELPEASFNHLSNVCKDADVFFTNTSVGAVEYLWDFGDGNTSTAVHPTHSYGTGGTYTITLIAFTECFCTDTFTSEIEVNSLSGPTISCPATVCANDTATYTADISGCSYEWIIDGGSILGPNNLQEVTVAWGAGQIGTISLLVTGCVSVCTDTTRIQVPIIPTNGQILGDTLVCSGSCVTYSLPAFSGTHFNWDYNGCGEIVDSTNCEMIEICWNDPFLFPCNDTLSVTFESDFLGCSGSAELPIRVRPELEIVGQPYGCANGNSSLFSNFGQNCFWSIDVAGPSIVAGPGSSTVINWNGFSGIAVVSAVLQNPNHACNDSVQYTIEVEPTPPAPNLIGDTLVCANTPVNYCSDYDGNLSWYVTGGTPAFQFSDCVDVTWNATGPYLLAATYQTGEPAFCKSDSGYLTVNVINTPASPIVVSDDTVCANSTTLHSLSNIYPAGVTYLWEIVPSNAGTITSGAGTNNITIEWGNNAPQLVTLKVDVTVCGQDVSSSHDIFLSPIPAPSINQIGSLCAGGTVDLEVLGGSFVTYNWNPSASGSLITVSNDGLYQVTVTDANGCSAITQHTVQEVSGPTASISSPNFLTHCIGDAYSVNICALGNPDYAYSWSTAATTQCITTSTPGSFTVTVTDNTNNCTASSNIITVQEVDCTGGGGDCRPQGIADFTHTNCNPVMFTDNSTGPPSGHQWNFGDGNTSTAVNPTHSYAEAGFYLVRLTVEVPNGNPPPATCVVFDSAVVEIPVVASFDAAIGCLSDSVCFTDKSTTTAGNNITSWFWDFGDGNTSTLEDPCHQYTSGGAKTVSLTVIAGGCSHTITETIDVPDAVTALFETDTLICTNVANLFTDLSFTDINRWSWTFGNGGTSLNQNPNFGYATAGSYTVQLNVTDISGCTDSVKRDITVVGPSFTGEITADPDTFACKGETIVLYAPTCINCTLNWSTGSTNDSIIVTQTGAYVLAIEDSVGCNYADVQVVNMILPPSVDLNVGNDPEICVGEFVQINTPFGVGNTYEWISSDPTVDGSLSSAIFYFPSAGTHTYQVVVTNTNTGCSDTSIVETVIVHPNPTAPSITLLGSAVTCANEPVKLVAAHPDITMNFSWNTGEIADTICADESGCYTLIATDSNGCSAQQVSCVTVHPTPELCNYWVGCFDTCAPYTIQAPIGNDAYQWLLNGTPIPGATDSVYEATIDGEYQVILTNSFGCTDTTGILALELYNCADTVCAALQIDSVFCDTNGRYTLLYSVHNEDSSAIDEWLLQITSGNAVVGPASGNENIPGGASSMQHQTTIYEGNAGDTVCLIVHTFAYDSLGDATLCCKSDTVCVVLPECEQPPTADEYCDYSFNDSICVNETSTFEYDGPSGVTLSWTFHNGTPNTASGPGPHTVTYNTTGCHLVDLVVIGDGFSFKCPDTICVFKKPLVSVDVDDDIIIAYPAGLKYQWYEIEGNDWIELQGEDNQFYQPATSSMYGVVATNPSTNCKDSAQTDYQTSITLINDAHWSLYPNPASSSIKIQADEGLTRVELFDVYGSVVVQSDLPHLIDHLVLPLNELSAGVYFVRIYQHEKIGLKRLMLQRD